jgi:hypothetical protein
MWSWNHNELIRHLQSENARLQAEVTAYREQNQRLLDRLLDSASSGNSNPATRRYPDVPAFRAPLANKEIDLFEDIEEAEANKDNRKEQYDSFSN